jgi:small subunit ribosomal protein S6
LIKYKNPVKYTILSLLAPCKGLLNHKEVMMRYYETIYILSPDLSQEEKTTIMNRLRSVVQKNGKIIKEEDWGKKRLAYPIKHKDYGNYIYIVYHASQDTVHKLEQEMNLQSDVLRFLTVRLENIEPFISKEEVASETAAES